MPARIRFISAGAGSGKTFALATLLHEELSSGRVHPGGVLATTFTTRAATELRERVQAHLVGAGAHALATAMGSARVGTVNSVCGLLLQRFAFEAGLSTEQRVLDEPSSALLLRKTLDAVIEGTVLRELLEIAQRLSLQETPRGDAEPPWRSALKTLVDQARCNDIGVEALRACGSVNADQLLSLFPARSANDLGAILSQAIRAALPALEEAALTGGKQNTTKYVALVKETLAALEAGTMAWSDWSRLAKAAPEKGLAPVAAPIAAAAGAVAMHPGLHRDLRRYLELMFGIAASALEAYDTAKRQLGALDFTDQERLLLGVLDHPTVRATLTDELDLLMVDEFQDTSPMQLALFLKLATHARQVVWVGDVKQAIYGFRGSDTRLMNAVIQGLPALGGTQEVLPWSWRSRPSLVDFVNTLFGTAFDGIDRANVVLAPKRAEFEGTAALADWSLAGKNKEAIQASLVRGIVRLVSERTQVFDAATQALRTVRLSDIAILARSNQSVTEIAAALRRAGVASATRQPGLLAEPEAVLALACLRRLNDGRDTLSTAEIVSLADCADPDAWLSDRLAWLAGGGDEAVWREAPRTGHTVHPILGTLAELRAEAVVLSPREAVELVLERCGLARRVIQWSTDPDRARTRLANLDRLIDLAVQYEDEALANRNPATLSGLLLWLQDLAAEKLDALAEPAVDAVQVLTHHGAKGLEWPVVVLCDLEADVRDRVWSIQAESAQAFDMALPLRGRFVRYWPWPFGAQGKTGTIASAADASETGQAARADAIEESKRLLYVSMTRARDLLVLARPAKSLTGEWMQTVGLDARLPAGEPDSFVVDGGLTVPFARWSLDGTAAAAVDVEPGKTPSLSWWADADAREMRPPLRVGPSSLAGVRATVAETVPLGTRIDTGKATDRARVGDAVHACLAAGLATPGRTLSVAEVEAILSRMEIDTAIRAADLHGQMLAVLKWLRTRWPDVLPQVELPVVRRRENGQYVQGRADLVLRTDRGWILIDHKSTPQGSAKWEALADEHAGQLAGYREVLEAASGVPVAEVWLLLPVAGAAIKVVLATEPEPSRSPIIDPNSEPRP